MSQEDFDTKALGGSVKRQTVNQDLQEERDKCNFDQSQLAEFLFGPQVITFVKKMHAIISTIPGITSSVEYFEMSRHDQMAEWWRRLRLVLESDDLKYALTEYQEEE